MVVYTTYTHQTVILWPSQQILARPSLLAVLYNCVCVHVHSRVQAVNFLWRGGIATRYSEGKGLGVGRQNTLFLFLSPHQLFPQLFQRLFYFSPLGSRVYRESLCLNPCNFLHDAFFSQNLWVKLDVLEYCCARARACLERRPGAVSARRKRYCDGCVLIKR